MSIVGLARATNGWKLVSDCAAERLTQGVGLLSCSNACSVSMYIWIVLAFELAPICKCYACSASMYIWIVLAFNQQATICKFF